MHSTSTSKSRHRRDLGRPSLSQVKVAVTHSREPRALDLCVCAAPDSFQTPTRPSSLAHDIKFGRKMPSHYSTSISELCRHESWRVGCLSCKQHHTMRQCAEVPYRIVAHMIRTILTIDRLKQSLRAVSYTHLTLPTKRIV